MTKSSYKKCLICDGKCYKILDLGIHAYADTFIKKSQLRLREPVLPLVVYQCKSCGGVQLGKISNDFERYNLYSYSYTSSNSAFSRNHWDEYAKSINKRFNIINKKVIEIGSNDGYLLQQFKKKNKVLGVDPSKDIAKIAKTKYGIHTITKLFNLKTSMEIKASFGEVDLIIANNVFNHSNSPLDFAHGVANLLSSDGIFVFELPYWKDTIVSKKFDQIYHEHVTYFTARSSFELLWRSGLQIIDIEEVDYHGGSLRVYAKKGASVVTISKLQKMIRHEGKLNLFKINTYKKFQKEIEKIRANILNKISKIKKEGGSVVAVGAAAKGNTLLNFYKLNHDVIDYVTDSSKWKQGKYTPQTRIPITSDDIFKKYGKVHALILSWNLSNTLKKNLLKINSKIKFI